MNEAKIKQIREKVFKEASLYILTVRTELIQQGTITCNSVEAQDLSFAAGLIYGAPLRLSEGG